MAKSIVLAADASRLAALLLSYGLVAAARPRMLLMHLEERACGTAATAGRYVRAAQPIPLRDRAQHRVGNCSTALRCRAFSTRRGDALCRSHLRLRHTRVRHTRVRRARVRRVPNARGCLPTERPQSRQDKSSFQALAPDLRGERSECVRAPKTFRRAPRSSTTGTSSPQCLALLAKAVIR